MNETVEWLYDIDSGMFVPVQQSVQTALPTHTHAHHRAEEWLYGIDSGMFVPVQQSVQTALPTHTHAHHRAEGNQSVPAE
ncbi:Uncharacterized protein OBRU01_12384 [Operophtera brumata]|uniref:Uncharacterized protein n=1 Tax=Operophtera brumata TaxID=104452 RepID=A0A0L7LAA8_OPEBR|nr:Uncharacterized protein OBRU01_12384 [Operophtera brumata]